MYLHKVSRPCLRDELRGWDIQKQLGVHSLLFQVELVCGLGVLSECLLDVFALMSSGPIPQETLNSLKGLCIPSGLGTPQDPPGGARQCCWAEEFLALPTASVTLSGG